MDSNNCESKNSFLKRELEAPSGLSLLVAALDAQDPRAFRFQHLTSASAASTDGHCNSEEAQRSSISPAMSQSSSIGTGGRRRSIPDTDKTEAYWEKRRRNNEAAKRSREKRRFNDMAMEAKLYELSKENNILKSELGTVKQVSRVTKFAPVVGPVAQTVVGSAGPMLPGSIASVMPHLGAALGANVLSPPQCNPLLASVMQPILFQAAAAAHQQRLSGVFDPNNIKQSSPDSTVNVGFNFDNPFNVSNQSNFFSSPAALQQSSQLIDAGKQYLRYKLLERQSRLNIPTPGSALLGSLASNLVASPATQRSAPFQVTKTEADSLSLKDCLSSLAVTLTSPTTSASSSSAPIVTDHCSPQSEEDHGYDTQDREHNSSGDTSCGDSSSGECGRSHTGSLSEEGFCGADPKVDEGPEDPRGSVMMGFYRRSSSGSTNGDASERYVERRRRNNEAAKRCRANRRALFEFRYQRAQELEHENNKLKDSIRQLSLEVAELKCLLSSRQKKLKPSPTTSEPMVICNGDDEELKQNEAPLDFSIKKA